MAHADTGRQTRTTASQLASAKRQAEALADFRRRQAQASKAKLEERESAARRISTAFAPPTEAERLGSRSGRNIPGPVGAGIRPLSAGPAFDAAPGTRVVTDFLRSFTPTSPQSVTGGRGGDPRQFGITRAPILSGGPAFDIPPRADTPRPVSTSIAPFLQQQAGVAQAIITGRSTVTRQAPQMGLEQPGDVPTETLGEIFRPPITFGRGPGAATTSVAPRTLAGTGPSPIQLGNPPQTLGDIDPLFPPGTVVSRAGGTIAAQLPDGRIVDLTRVETYGQLVAESLDRWLQTGNPDMRPTNIREEWALSFSHLWEDDFENVTDFLTAMGFRLIPGTNGNWIRENPFNISSPASSGGGGGGFRFPGQVVQSARGSAAAPVSRGRVSSLGLTQWGITPGG